jgi:hypothetical protein
MEDINKNIRTTLYPLQIKSASATEVTFYTDADIKEAKRIISVEAFSASQVPFSPDRFPVVNDAVFKKSSISLVNVGGTTIRHLALPSISKSNNTFIIEKLNIERIGLEKCKVHIGDNAGVVVGEVFLFQITYEK